MLVLNLDVICKMNVVTLTLTLAMATLSVASPTPTPTPSLLSCNYGICMDGRERFNCMDRGFVCCRGGANDSFQVFTKRDGFRCCDGAGEMYNMNREICVNHQVRLRRPNEDNCGPNKVFNMTDQVCCGKTNVFDKMPGAECCGTEYTGPNESCCNGVMYKKWEKVCCPRLDNNPALGKSQLFDIPYGKCCLEKPYSPTTHTCTSEFTLVNRERSEMPTCKANEIYDPETHGCCRGATTLVYEHRTHLCSRGILYEKTDPQQNDVCIYTTGRQRMAVPFAKNDKTVCSASGVISLGPLEAECGSDLYNTSKDLCCGKKIHRNAKRHGLQCCDGTNAYNPSLQVCCMNEVKEGMAYNNGARCCRKEPYQPETHECKRGVVTKRTCPEYGSKCNVTIDALQKMKKIYLYFGIPKAMKPAKSTRKKSATAREWSISDMQTFKIKRGKISLVNTKSKGDHTLKAAKCGCPENLEIGRPYVFVSGSSIKRKTLSFESDRAGFIVPVAETRQIGLIFEALIENRRS